MNRAGALILLVAAVALAGCGRREHRPAEAQAVLRYPMVIEPSTLDPALVKDVYAAELLQNIFEGLVAFDAGNKLVARLAERWEVSADGKTYTFHLREKARFHTPFGRPVTASDVKYSLERALWPETRSPVAANYLAGIVGVGAVAAGSRRDLPGVKVIDARTVAITLDRPRSYFLGMLTYPTGWVVCKEAIEKNSGRLDEKAAIGTGPFQLQEYRHGAKVVLAANPDYHGGRPALSRIERPIVLDPQTRHVMYENNALDLAQIALSDYVNDQKRDALRSQLQLRPTAGVGYLVMHPGLQPAFRNRRVRRAFALAIDRDAIVRVAALGVWPRADRFLPAGLPGADPSPRKRPYDPDAARRLLSEAGYPGGQGFPRLTLVFVEKNPELSRMAQIIRDNLRAHLGITIDLQEREGATFFEDTANQEKIPFYVTGWVADYLDPQDFLSTLFRTGAALNHVGYSNPRFDALCDQADAESDTEKRFQLYRQADAILLDDVGVLPLVYFTQPILIKPHVRDFQANLMLFLPQTRTRIER